MDARDGGGVAESLAVRGGSALTKSRRPVWSMTLVIWALAWAGKKTANKTSVVRNMQAVSAVRLAILLTCYLRPQSGRRCLGEGGATISGASGMAPKSGTKSPSELGPAAGRLTRLAELGSRGTRNVSHQPRSWRWGIS